MDKIKKMWRNLSLRKSIILYISAFVILAILLSAGTATLCNNATKTIESKYPPTGEKYYLTNENGERLGDGNYIGVAPVAMSEKDQRLLSICEVAPIIATPIYSALCIITATLLFYRNKLKKPLTELKAASEMISNNNLDFSIKYDSKDELGELCSSFETMRFTIAQAMLNNPRILILDEPTAGLDPKERVRFRNLISAFSKDRIVILSTHIVSDVEFIAEDIIMMKDGQILHFGKTQEITTEIDGQVWECTVPTSRAEQYSETLNISNLRNIENNCTVLRVISEQSPMENAIKVEPTLEDLYLFYFKGVNE